MRTELQAPVVYGVFLTFFKRKNDVTPSNATIDAI